VDIRLICCDGNQTGVVQESGLRRVNKVHRGQGQDLCREPPEPWTCWCRIPNIQYSTYNIILYYPAPARTSYSYILFQPFRCHRVSSSCQAPSEFLTHLTTQLNSTQLNSTQLHSTQLNSTPPNPSQPNIRRNAKNLLLPRTSGNHTPTFTCRSTEPIHSPSRPRVSQSTRLLIKATYICNCHWLITR
jgi:hypothetical protein